MPHEHIHFLTGKLAEPLLRDVLSKCPAELIPSYTIQVLPISVAALLTTDWIAPRMQAPEATTRVVLPGYVRGALQAISSPQSGVHVELGPKDLRDLPAYLGGKQALGPPSGYGGHDIEILAEINLAPSLSPQELLAEAKRLRGEGADVIDLGCAPGEFWRGVGDAVRMLCQEGLRVSIDSMNTAEIALAAAAGAELVLSVNSANVHAAPDWGIEVTAIPDDPATGEGLASVVEKLIDSKTSFRIDPIVQPIGFGFAASLQRYQQARAQWPACEMLMGIGNLTELTDVDSAGVNVILLAICQELGIRSVLTTQVTPWARTSVRECDVGRQLVHYAIRRGALPKRVDSRLVMLRDARLNVYGIEQLDALAPSIKDHNIRLFAEEGHLHAIAEGRRWSETDAYLLFDRLRAEMRHAISPDHAFYLGYELAKATTALTLGKEYRQDEALDWGLLTRVEESHLSRRRSSAEPDNA